MPLDLGELLVHQVEVVAVDLDDDLPTDAGDGLLDTVFDGLAEIVLDARAGLELGAHGIHDLGLGSAALPLALGFHHDERLGLVGRLVVGPVFGVALLGEDVTNLGKLEQRQPGLAQHLGAPLERCLARHRDGHVDIALVHFRKELGPQPGNESNRACEHQNSTEARRHGKLQCLAQGTEVAIAQEDEKRGLLLANVLTADQDRTESRNAGEGKEQRSAKSEPIGERDGSEDSPLDAFEGKNGHHGGNDDGQRKKNGTDHLFGGLGDHAGHLGRRRPLLGDVPIDVFYENHGAIEQDSKVDRPHRQHVRRYAHEVQPDERDQEGQRHRDGDGERTTKSTQKQPQHQGY